MQFLSDLFLNASFIKIRHHSQESLTHLRHKVAPLKNLPQHIGIIVDFKDHCRDNCNLESIAKFVCWCSGAGISYITLYDISGIMKGSREILNKCIGDFGRHFFGTKALEYNIELHGECTATAASEKLPNQSNIYVQLLSGLDGHVKVIEVARNLAQEVKNGALGVADISEPMFSAHLRKLAISLPPNAPDEPDFILYLPYEENKSTPPRLHHIYKMNKRGKTKGLENKWISSSPLVLDGFMPWHTRLSEIIRIPVAAKNCPMDSFIDALVFYTRREKRHGV